MSHKNVRVHRGVKIVGIVMGYEHWASYFINCDPSGLTDEERQAADEFMGKVRKQFGATAHILDSKGGSPQFGHPSFGGLKGSVISYVITL